MSHELPAPTHYTSSDTLEINVTVEDGDDPDGGPKDLLGGAVSYAILDSHRARVLLDDDDEGITAEVTDTAGGEITVTIDADTTTALGGTYRHRLRVVDNGGRRKTFIGELTIEDGGPD